jgi:DNA-binding transcriptional MerR regulator
MEGNKKLLRPKEAMALVGVTRRTWRKLVEVGLIEPVTLDGLSHRRYLAEDVRKLIPNENR